ncbi:single-stranded DNA-binding protein [Desulforhopalus vacuolatus]|uniref:single-stranded DNA-binding protein n=1 Tax=Desulforhopalus vacuolatus TaxID=40414 RepID=UPI001965890E|nr:single-stranded DNA-binding protein [Desulforhopalus vacuolatus]MBM9519020.1 single-stranded DNA-binding protein [Desulforhopalus vacuolatus]
MVNKVILIGNLGANPELRYTNSGTAVASLRVATSRRRKDQASGQYIEETEWHSVVAWAKTAEFCSNYLSKGSKIYVEGRLQTRKWQDKNGNDRYTTEIISENLQSLSPRSSGGGGGGDKGSGFNDSSASQKPFTSGSNSDNGGFGGGSGGFDNGGFGGDSGNSGTGDDVPF